MPNVDFDDAFRESTDYANRILETMNAGPLATTSIQISSGGGFDVPNHHRFSVGMYARARSYFSSVLIMIEKRRADEALTLCRSLFEDSLRLDILAALPTESDRVDAVMNWVLDGLNREVGLLKTSASTGVGEGHEDALDDALAALDDQRKNAIAYRSERGSGQRKRNFFSEQNLESRAKATGRGGAWWMHEVGDQMVHGGHFSHRLRHEELGDNAISIDVSFDHPALLSVVAYACESAVICHHSICSLLGFDLDEELNRWLAAIGDP